MLKTCILCIPGINGLSNDCYPIIKEYCRITCSLFHNSHRLTIFDGQDLIFSEGNKYTDLIENINNKKNKLNNNNFFKAPLEILLQHDPKLFVVSRFIIIFSDLSHFNDLIDRINISPFINYVINNLNEVKTNWFELFDCIYINMIALIPKKELLTLYDNNISLNVCDRSELINLSHNLLINHYHLTEIIIKSMKLFIFKN